MSTDATLHLQVSFQRESLCACDLSIIVHDKNTIMSEALLEISLSDTFDK